MGLNPTSRRAETERVAICVATYLRPVGLGRLLRVLQQLDPVEGVEPVVVIVDNDPEGSARKVVEEAPSSPLQLVYCHETQRGIPFARNRALAAADQEGAAWVAWIDDDELPRSDWLATLFATQRAADADVVMGPSEAVFDPTAPDWIIATGAFATERFTDGEPYPYFHSRTSGLLHRAALSPAEGFDNRMVLTGGSDRLFFTRMHRAGASFVWSDEAVVEDWVPASRTSASWLVKRWFRIGVTRTLTMRYLDEPGWVRRLRRVAGGTLMATQGLVAALVAVPKGKTETLVASRRVFLGAGAAWGALGLGYNEYRKVHGT